MGPKDLMIKVWHNTISTFRGLLKTFQLLVPTQVFYKMLIDSADHPKDFSLFLIPTEFHSP